MPISYGVPGIQGNGIDHFGFTKPRDLLLGSISAELDSVIDIGL